MPTARNGNRRSQRCKRWCQVFRNIWRTFVWTLGLSLVAAFVGHVIWFRFGWEDLPLRCFNNVLYPGWQELSGELRPQVADSLETMLRTLYGEAAVKRSGPGQIKVRPAVIYFDDKGRLADMTALLTYMYGQTRGSADQQSHRASNCRLSQHHLMVGGLARSCWDPWEPHVYGIVDQDSWPWLTRMLGVRQPDVSSLEDLATLTLPIRMSDPPRLASRTTPDEVDYCFLTYELRLLTYAYYVFGDIVVDVRSLWPP